MESSRPEPEEGLTLFQHMRAREHRNYLNNCKDDIEEIKYEDGLSTFRISASTPTRGGGLLVFDAEKNDYDWLLTPPGTPLFPSLDQETDSLNLFQRPPFTGPASALKPSKEPPWQSPSELSSLCRLSGVPVARTTAHANPSPQRESTASPSRTSTSSSKARSPSPSPSSTRSHPSMRAFSPGRSATTTTGQSPARTSKSMSKSLTSSLCQNNTSPLLGGGHGYSARRGPRRSLSPRLGPWEPVMAACSTESPPNLRTSPSNRSIQRGNVEGSAKGASFRIGGSSLETVLNCNQPSLSNRSIQRGNVEGSAKGASFRVGGSSLETVLNCNRPKWRAMSADSIESSSFSNKLKQISKDSEVVVRRNINRGLSIAEVSLSEDNQNGSYVRKQAPVSTFNKEMLSDFANKKMEWKTPTRRSLHNMFRPLMSSAPATLYHKTKPESSNYEMCRPASPSMSGNGSSKRHLKALPDIDCSHTSVERGELSQRHCSFETGPRMVKDGLRKLDFPCKTHDYDCMSEVTSRTNLEEETGAACAGTGNQMFVNEQFRDSQSGRVSQTPLPIKPESNVDVKDLSPVIQNNNSRNRRQQMLNARLNREKLSEHGREEHIMLSNKSQTFAGNNFYKDSVELKCDSLSPQAFKNKSCYSQYGARLPVRRQLTMANADMVYGTWGMKKTESFDISTSDSYSCSESLDSSFVDNRTEKFSEDLSEVDSMSHTGFSSSNLSATIYSLHNLISLEKPLSEMPTEIDTEQDKVLYSLPRNSGRAGLEASDLLRKSGENKQGMQASTKSMDSPHFLDRVHGNHRLSMENVQSFMQALDLKQSQSSAQLLYTGLDVQGKCPATGLNLNGGEREGGETHAVKSILMRAVTEGTRDWDENCEQVQPQTSPLKRNVTLEEATDTILFCSSIVHEIVYEAAALGEERCNMNTEDPGKGCGLVCSTESGRSSPCWSWNRRRQPLHNNVVHESIDPERHSETMPSVKCGGDGPPSPQIAGELQQKRTRRSGFCCFSS